MNDNNDLLTKEIFQAGMEKLAAMVQQGFLETDKKIEDLRNDVTLRIQTLEEYVNKFQRSAEGRFDAIFYELKEIRRELKEVDTRADVVDLQIRVGKLERKIKIKREV